jgi:rubrerythrin
MKYETFVEKFNELSTSEKVAIFNNYCLEYGDSNNMLNSFDEEFFELAFSNPMEAARATFFGDIQNWSDEYIRFDGYGNLESVNAYDVDEEIEGYLGEIFEHEKTWEDYIEEDEEDDEEESTFVCPCCGHVFKQGEYAFNYDTALLDFVCPDCDWEGDETEVEHNEEE